MFKKIILIVIFLLYSINFSFSYYEKTCVSYKTGDVCEKYIYSWDFVDWNFNQQISWNMNNENNITWNLTLNNQDKDYLNNKYIIDLVIVILSFSFIIIMLSWVIWLKELV